VTKIEVAWRARLAATRKPERTRYLERVVPQQAQAPKGLIFQKVLKFRREGFEGALAGNFILNFSAGVL
jgi:hypothetical protein